MLETILIIFLIILLNAVFSMAEISLAASRQFRLEQMAATSHNAKKLLNYAKSPNLYIGTIQLAVNLLGIFVGSFGEQSITPHIKTALTIFNLSEAALNTTAMLISVFILSLIFMIFGDIIPKRIALLQREKLGCILVTPMGFIIAILRPIVFIVDMAVNFILQPLNLKSAEPEVTAADLKAAVESASRVGVLENKEKKLIENVFSLENRASSSAMTTRDNIIYFDLDENINSLRNKILSHPHARFPICRSSIDQPIGYIESVHLLTKILSDEKFDITHPEIKKQIKPILLIPDNISLLDLLERFRESREDFALVANEYGTIVGLLTLNDLFSAIMGDVVPIDQEQMIYKRDNNSWLIDGRVSIEEVKKIFGWKDLPGEGNYETIGGFLNFVMKKIPKKTDKYEFAGVIFEVMDTEQNRVDEVLATIKSLNKSN